MVVDKRQRFIALAEKRVNRAIEDIRLIGNLSNKHNYTYSEEDARKIVAALEGETRLLKKRFLDDAEKSKSLFKL